MPEDIYSSQVQPGRKTGGSLRGLLGAMVLAFLAGAALIGWMIWDGRLALPGSSQQTAAVAPSPAASAAPSAAPSPQANLQLEQQVAALEQRLARIDLQAAAAEGNTARAEAMLVALAARRAIERGTPLGYIEGQLRLRFGAARPAAVNTVIAAAKDPVTLMDLSSELEQLGPALSGAGPDDTAWSRFRRQVSGLFVVHRDAPGAGNPANRMNRAQLLLRSGDIDGAIEVVAAMPGGKAATDWIIRARRYANAMQALDQIEQAALAEPEKLKAGTGEEIRQPGPVTAPSPSGTPLPAGPEGSF